MRTIALAAAGLVFALATASRAGDPVVGEPAPDFRLVGAGGQRFTRADFAGRRAVVLAFFPKAFTPG